jgi:glycosyltransferase involved in cell wall biosynthesis
MQEHKVSDTIEKQITASQPLVSVIMPCYNAARFLKEALDSIIHQTYSNLEIIVINDGSTDVSSEMLENYARNDSRIILINHEMNKGLVYSLNEGVAKAGGEFIARMDADDISVLNRIEVLLNFLLLHPRYDVVSSGFCYLDQLGKRGIAIEPKGTLPLALKFFSFFATPIAHACSLGKAACFRKFSYDQNFVHSEDYDLFSRMALSDVKLYNLTSPLYYIRLHSNRVSDLFEQQQVDSHLRISERNLAEYFDFKTSHSIHALSANRYIGEPNIREIKEAIEFISRTKRSYLIKESCTKEEIEEIEMFVNEQHTDIIIQAFKNSTFWRRTYLLQLLPDCLLLLVKPHIIKYLWIKLRIRI